MQVPTRDHLWANCMVGLENNQQQEKYWFGEFLVRRIDLTSIYNRKSICQLRHFGMANRHAMPI